MFSEKDGTVQYLEQVFYTGIELAWSNIKYPVKYLVNVKM